MRSFLSLFFTFLAHALFSTSLFLHIYWVTQQPWVSSLHFGPVKPYGKNRNDDNAKNHSNSDLWADRLQFGECNFGRFAFNEAVLCFLQRLVMLLKQRVSGWMQPWVPGLIPWLLTDGGCFTSPFPCLSFSNGDWLGGTSQQRCEIPRSSF